MLDPSFNPDVTEKPGGVSSSSRTIRLPRARWLLIASAVVLLMGVPLVFNFNSVKSAILGNPAGTAIASPSSTSVRRMPVRVEQIKSVHEISQKREYTGVIRAKRQAALGFELTGRIDSVQRDEGDVVEAGDVLAKLDIRTLNAKRDATAASLAQAVAVLDEMEAGPRLETIESMRAQLQEARSRLGIAELNLSRREKLRESRSISVEEFERALYDFRATQSQFDTVQQQLDELEAGTRSERITAQEAAIAQLTAAQAEIDVLIEKSSLIAPFSGKIVQRMADPGGIVTPSSAVLKIVEVENLEAVIGLPVGVAANLKRDDQVTIAVAGKTYPANVLAIIQQLDTATRTQNVLFQLGPKANGMVLPGQLCQIEIATDVEAQGFWVPASALTNGIRGLWSLMVVDQTGTRALRRDVEVIYTDGDRALVRGTLADGVLIIVAGTHRIVDGQAIEIVPDDLQSTAADQQP